MANPKKWKCSYQKQPTGVKLDNIINDVLSTDPNKKCQIRKRRYKFNLILVKKVFKRKEKKEKPLSQGQKKLKKKKRKKKKKKMHEKLKTKSSQYLTVASHHLMLYTEHALSVLMFIISLVHTLCPILVIMFQV